MATITLKTNIPVITERLKERLAILGNKEYLLRPVCFDVIELMTKRIHIDGKASDDSQIGTYSKSYMALRTGNYQNADRFKKGAQKGKNKNAGTNTVTGKPRPNYHRSSDPKIIVSLTRQLENDWSVIATLLGYGVGFLNPFNMQKARWVEANTKKKIFNLAKSEGEHAVNVFQSLVKKAMNEPR